MIDTAPLKLLWFEAGADGLTLAYMWRELFGESFDNRLAVERLTECGSAYSLMPNGRVAPDRGGNLRPE